MLLHGSKAPHSVSRVAVVRHRFVHMRFTSHTLYSLLHFISSVNCNMNLLTLLVSCLSLASGTILQNGQVRITDYPDTTIASIAGHNHSWRTYPPNARELSYKGRWDDHYISWWTAPGLKFGFQGSQIAIAFGNNTSPGVLIAYRVGGLDWQLTNVSASTTHLLADSQTTPFDEGETQTFELRVTNWDYGVQIQNVYVAGGRLVQIPDYRRRVEIIGDSLSAGQYATLEGIASYSWGLAVSAVLRTRRMKC